MTLGELLQPYVDDKTPERLVCLIDDLEAMRVVAVWPFLPKSWKAPRSIMPTDLNERWAWIWDGVDFNDDALAVMTDMPRHRLDAKVTMLASARILFPDGTVPTGARAIVQGRIQRDMKRLPIPKKDPTP